MFLSPMSPYNLSDVVQDDGGRLAFALRRRLLWEDLEGVRTHVCKEGDTLQYLAQRYYGDQRGQKGGGARLWWIIADFQPEPLNDPTIDLEPGRIVLIPPLAAIQAALAGEGEDIMMEAE